MQSEVCTALQKEKEKRKKKTNQQKNPNSTRLSHLKQTKNPNQNQMNKIPKPDQSKTNEKTLWIYLYSYVWNHSGDFSFFIHISQFLPHCLHQDRDVAVQDWRKLLPVPFCLLWISRALPVNTTAHYNRFPESQTTCSPKENVTAHLVGRRKVSLRPQVDVIQVSQN